MKIMSVVGARPNFMKIAPFLRALSTAGFDMGNHCLVHTGQHYDAKMSDSFFKQLSIPEPDIDLGVGSGTHAEQVGRTMIEFEKAVRQEKPDWIVVVGDVNATCACALVAKKEHIKLAHIEAGLRSFDLDMPEEINRMVADRLSDILFTTDEIANINLRNEGVPEDKIRFVGDIMIDTLEANREKANAIKIENVVTADERRWTQMSKEGFAMLTLHRPSNVDHKKCLEPLVRYLVDELSREMPLVWTLHPRTRSNLDSFGLLDEVKACERIILLDPLGYLEMLKLNMSTRIMLTDSGGLQEECCVLGTPCVTLRENTERPVTLRENGGVAVLTGNDIERIRHAVSEFKDLPRHAVRPPLWDGHAAERIVKELLGQDREQK